MCQTCCPSCCSCCCSPTFNKIGHAILAASYLALSIGLVVYMIKEVFVMNDAPWEGICVAQVVRHRRCVFAVGQVVEKGVYLFALGQQVCGVVAIGQLSMGLVSFGMAGIGLIFSAYMVGVNVGVMFCMAGLGVAAKGMVTLALVRTTFFKSLVTWSVFDLTAQSAEAGGLASYWRRRWPAASMVTLGGSAAAQQQQPGGASSYRPPPEVGADAEMGYGPSEPRPEKFNTVQFATPAAPVPPSDYGYPTSDPSCIKTYQVAEPSAPLPSAGGYGGGGGGNPLADSEVVVPAEAVAVVSVQQRLVDLRALLDQGLISYADFERRKEEILREV